MKYDQMILIISLYRIPINRNSYLLVQNMKWKNYAKLHRHTQCDTHIHD